ncbi:MAG TPA: ATP-binding SpoIIE family protein phosphatase [Thermoanaerobaculia bacterium]|nr:ATP-binding SpoIIE family protein phosphatase [Thermoanaerobaculia bacterium]
MIHIGQVLAVNDSSQVSAARRTATQCAEALGLNANAVGMAALVATELATNILKHGDGGSMLFGSVLNGRKSLVLVACDRGPGIANIARAMEDGYSTAGSPGTGLGAIARNATSLDVYSQAGKGTVVLCRVEDGLAPLKFVPDAFAMAGICIAKTGEEHSGDAWVGVQSRDFATIAIADGLGHGVFAATASSAAVRVIAEKAESPIEHIFQDAHGALRATRGAAIGIARISRGQNRVDFAGVGNIAGTIALHETSRRTVSLGGIVGHEMRRVQTFSYPWESEAVLILASDGISTSWNASQYPGLLQRDPALIASVLFRDHCRGNDDATVVVVKAA